MPNRTPRHRDPSYVRAQLEKPKVLHSLEALAEIAVNPQEEVTVSQTEIQEKTVTEETALSQEVQDEINEFLGDNGISVEAVEVVPANAESESTPEAITEEKTKLKAEKTPRAPKTAAVPSRLQEGNCKVCGKGLTNSVSVYRGIGPVCWNQMQRQFQWDAATAKEKLDPQVTPDAEWMKLVDEIHDLLYKASGEAETVPEGYVEASKFWRAAEKYGLSGSAISRAVGGDRGVGTPLSEEFHSVYVHVGNRMRRYLPPEAMTDEAFKKIEASQKPRILTGAAKDAKSKADAKKQAGAAKKEETVGNVTKLADGSFS